MGDFDITKREIIASISIIAIMLVVGILISGKISDSRLDTVEIYNKAVKIEDRELFEYGMRTNVGNALVYGDLKTVDPVSYPDIDGEYMSVKKVTEEYTKHTRKVTKTRTRSDGTKQKYTETEEYWSWDDIDSESKHCNKVTFLGVEFDYGQIFTPGMQYIDTIDESWLSDIRYVYYGSDTAYTGTLFTKLKDKTINDSQFFNNNTINETLDIVSSSGIWVEILFWIFWIGLTGGLVFLFYYADNNWLE